jgi:hypothetical protein
MARGTVPVTCPAKAYQVEVEDSACVVGLWPEIPAVFALNRLYAGLCAILGTPENRPSRR